MPTDFEELKRKLLQSDEEFRQLATKHHDLDEKLHNLRHSALPHRTRASRRSHPQKTKTAFERPDGEHPAPTRECPQAAPARSLTLPIQSRARAGGAARMRMRRPGPFPSPAATSSHENRPSRVSVHCRRAGAGGARRRGAASGDSDAPCRCSAASSPISSATPTEWCRRTPASSSRRPMARS